MGARGGGRRDARQLEGEAVDLALQAADEDDVAREQGRAHGYPWA